MWSTIAKGLKWGANELLPGLVGTAGNIAGSIIGTNNTQSRAMQNWMTQQEYNTPENQMKRLQDAGINPHLAFAKGNVNNVSTSQPTTPEMKINAGLEEFAKYQQISNLRAQNDYIKAQAAKAWTDADVAEGTKHANIYMREAELAIKEIEELQKRFGVDGAEQMVKVLFQDWYRRTKDDFDKKTGEIIPAEMDISELRTWLKGVVITKEIAKGLTALGLGRLLGGRKTKSKPYQGYKNTRITNYNYR